MQRVAIASRADVEAVEAAPYDAFIAARGVPEGLDLAAARWPERPALSFAASADAPLQTWTHAEWQRLRRQAANLLHGLGVDDRCSVAMLLPAVPAAYLTLFGGEAAGRVCPINYLLDVESIAALLDASNATVLVALGPCDALDVWAKAEALRERCPALRQVLAAHHAAPDAPSFEDLLAEQPADRLVFEPAIGRDTVAATFHTGGTTGAPKLAQHTHGNQLHSAWCAAQLYAADERDGIVNGFPLFHVAGAFVYGLSLLLGGGHVVLPTLLGFRDGALMADYWRFADRAGATLVAAVPTLMATLLAQPAGAGPGPRSRLRALYTGGSPLPGELAAQFEQRFGLPVRNILGMTECAGVVSIEPFGAPRIAGSCGLRLPFTEVRALDDDGRALAAGATGIVALRGPNVSPGYTDAARNAGTFADGGWLVSGDVGHVDADGRVFITGRAKDLIIRSGHNLDPGLIEAALLQHPAVQMAAAVGEPDEYAGELPVAFVSLRPGAAPVEPAELLAFAAPRIGERPAWPKRLSIVESLPLTAIGKVYKPALRLRAIEQALVERLAARGLAGRVRVEGRDGGRRLSVAFRAAGGARDAELDAAVRALMAPFAIDWSWTDDDER